MHNCNDSFLFFLSLSVVTPAFHIGLFSSTQLLYKRKKKKPVLLKLHYANPSFQKIQL